MDAYEPRTVALFIEDRPSVQMFITGLLREAGVEGSQAAKGGEALIDVRAHPDVHAIMSDIELPDRVNRFGVARAIRERWPAVWLVITTGPQSSRPDDLPKGFIFLANAHLLDLVINVIRQMATLKIVEPGLARTAAADPS